MNAGYFATHGLQLLAAGFEPIPLNGKRPFLKHWEDTVLSADQLGFWVERYGALNVGLRTGKLAAVDIDLYDADVADRVFAAFVERFGPAPVRLGQAPKQMLVYAAAAPGTKITSSSWYRPIPDVGEKENRVEILGVGQQFVAYGIHPDTHQPYTWPGDSLLDMEVWELPVLDLAEAAQWIRDVLPTLIPVDWAKKGSGASGGAAGDGDDAFDAVKQRHDDVDLDALRWMLAQLPLERCDDREDWRNTIFAVHHQFTGTEFEEVALDLVDTWSSQSHKHVTGVVPAIWQEAKEQRGGGLVTIGTLKAWLGDTWKNYRKTAVTQEAVVQTLDWSDRIRVADEVLLLGALAAEIRVAHLTALDRAALVKMYQRRLKELKGVLIEIKEVRRLLEAPRAERSTEDQVSTDDPFFLGPDWAKAWFWVGSEDAFVNRKTKQLCSLLTFNTMHKWDVTNLSVKEGDRDVMYSPYDRMATHWRVKVVDKLAYHPRFPEVFELGGLTFANTYRDDLRVKPDKTVTAAGKKLVAAVERHLQLLIPDTRERDLFRAWLAHNYLHPGVKIRWAPLLKGAEGDGKSLFGELLQILLGMPNVRTMSADTVQNSPFSGWSAGQCVVVLEEVKFHGHNRFDVVNKLKPYISNNSVELHSKGKDPMNALNVSNYLALTNHDDAMPLAEGDRRYFVIRSPWKTKTDLNDFLDVVYDLTRDQHFDQIFDLGRDNPGQLALWLSNAKIPAEFKPDGEAPATEAKRQMIHATGDDIESLVFEVLEAGRYGVLDQEAIEATANAMRARRAAEAETDPTAQVPLRKLAEELAKDAAARRKAAGFPEPLPDGADEETRKAYEKRLSSRGSAPRVKGVGPNVLALPLLKSEIEQRGRRPVTDRRVREALDKKRFRPMKGPPSRGDRAQQVPWQGTRPAVWVRDGVAIRENAEAIAELDRTISPDFD